MDNKVVVFNLVTIHIKKLEINFSPKTTKKIGTFIYPIDSWLLAIWAMQKTWAVIPSRANRIKHLARTTIWRPKQMTCDDQIKLTYGALAALCTSCSIWKSCSIIAILTTFAVQFAIFVLKQILMLAKSNLRISMLSKSIFILHFWCPVLFIFSS